MSLRPESAPLCADPRDGVCNPPPAQRSAAQRRHELLTPMNHILGYSEMLLEEAESDPSGDLHARLSEIHQRARRLFEFITEIFNPGADVAGAQLRARSAAAGIMERVGALTSTLEPALQPVFLPDLHKVLTAAGVLLGELETHTIATKPAATQAAVAPLGYTSGADRVLVVDDVEGNREVLARRLQKLGFQVETADNGRTALERLQAELFDLVLLDVMMPEMDGYETLRAVKADPQLREIPVIMISALTEIESIARCIEMGAEDYLPKPFNPVLLKARVNASLEKKHLRDRDLAHRRQIELYTNTLEELVQEKVRAISLTQLSTIFALSKLAESRDPDTGAHLERLREYCKVLAMALAARGDFPQIDRAFIDDLYTASPMHDIGKVGIPDHVLQKPGQLTEHEYEVMKTHATLGAETLRAVDREHPGNGFIRIGIEVAECHHERWDGAGYPYGLAGEAIPLSARILALTDVYDALRSKRCYKASYDHQQARTIIESLSGTHFDPRVTAGFHACEAEFDAIWQRLNPQQL